MFAKTKHEPAKQSRGSSPFSHSAKTAHCPSLAQASLEYLLTYGWALILIATIVGVLVLIVSTPSGYACSRGLGRLICKAFGAQGEDLIITLQNATGQDISINPFSGIAFDGRAGYAIITYRGQQYRFEPATISKGDTFQITGIGLGEAGTASITYTETQTGMTRTETINLDTPNTETCNNGKDDDADGATDCADTECKAFTECTYIPRATSGSGDGVIEPGASEEFTFDLSQLGSELWDKHDQFQITLVEFTFFIEGTAPPTTAKPTITLVTTGGNMVTGDPKTAWNTTESLPIIGTLQNITFSITNHPDATQNLTIAAANSTNAPVATIKVREMPEV